MLVQVGGEGTPLVQDFCLGEIALARGTGVTATTNALADRLDLEFRMPLTWPVCREGRAEVGIARKVARMSRHLPLAAMALVDKAIARIIATRVRRPGAGRGGGQDHRGRPRAAPASGSRPSAASRYVSSARTDEFGLRTVIARCEAGDAVWVEATVARVAEIIAPRHPEATADELRVDRVRLARPPRRAAGAAAGAPRRAGAARPRPRRAESPRETSRAMAFPADLLDALREADLTPLAPKAVLYVHLHEAAVTGAAAAWPGSRASDRVTYASLAELLARTDLVVKPVIDLSDRVRSTAYEHPESLKERVHLTTGGDYWPYATSTARNVDYDHPIPSRRHRSTRADRHPQLRPAGPSTSPLEDPRRLPRPTMRCRADTSGSPRTGWGFLVDHHGTRRISAVRPSSSSTPQSASTSIRSAEAARQRSSVRS